MLKAVVCLLKVLVVMAKDVCELTFSSAIIK